LQKLSLPNQEALLLVGAEGLSYEQAAEVCGVSVGTIKSRVNRARERLSQLLSAEAGDLGLDQVFQAASQSPDIFGVSLR
jgi:RNA polymerase sigma-70 factor (ECF subfamily)